MVLVSIDEEIFSILDENKLIPRLPLLKREGE